MFIDNIEIFSFRNLQSVRLKFHNRLNYIIGDNAQGKTNLIEAVYILCLAKSFKTTDDSECVPYGEHEYRLDGHFDDDNHISRKVVVLYSASDGKIIRCDGKSIRRFSALFGQFPIVVLSSNDHAITNGAPSQRRRFFNILLSQCSASYLRTFKQYDRVLKQRNKALSAYSSKQNIPSGELTGWDEQLVHYGAQIMKDRVRIVDDLNEKCRVSYPLISGSQGDFRIAYHPSVPFLDSEEVEENFRSKLRKIGYKEKKMGVSLVGPHRDEFIFSINGNELRRFGSRGEHKSALVCLKAAETDLLKTRTDIQPILLLDDLFAELDKDRCLNVIELFDSKSQTFITGTTFDYDRIKSEDQTESAVFQLESGHIIAS